MAKKCDPEDWRSTCPVSRLLEIIGDKWSMLVIRDLIFGKTRFKEFIASPEGIPTNILTDRLNRFLEHGLVTKEPIGDSGKRHAYHLTEKGESLRPVLRTMAKWGLKYEEGTSIGMKKS